MVTKLFNMPFAKNGDVEPVPNTLQLDGSVSYNSGFGADYDRQLGVDPQAKNIERENFNAVMLDVTTALQEMQAGYGVSPYNLAFAQSLPGGGYPLGAAIPSAAGTTLWMSTVAANTTDPDAGGAGWVQVPPRNSDYAVGSGTANAQTATFSPAIPAVDGVFAKFKAVATNTGAMTFNGATVLGGGGQALQGGEIVAGGLVTLGRLGANWVIVEASSGAVQVPPASQSRHALQFGQVSGIIGATANLLISVAAASSVATVTADEVIVESALGGLRYCIPNFNKTINLANTGLGGMDVAASAPASGFVAIYAGYNPATGASGMWGVNATSAKVGNIYNGSAAPFGFTATALVSVWPTDASKQFVVGLQREREIAIANTIVLSTAVAQASLVALTVNAIPKNAVAVRGDFTMTSSVAGAGLNSALSGSPWELGRFGSGINSSAAGTGITISYPFLTLLFEQTLYYRVSISAGTLSYLLAIAAYKI